VTLDDDVVALPHRLMKERGVSFTTALNDAVRRSSHGDALPTHTAELGVPAVNLDRALQLAAEVEDEELIRRQPHGA
jgi:hypothetical protein